MPLRKGLIVIVVLLTFGLDTGLALGDELCGECTLTYFQENFNSEAVEITSATIRNEIESPIPGGDPIPAPEYCEVRGVRFYDPFIIKLPKAWNGRYYQVGNGGAAGDISVSGIDAGLLKGYAAAGASGGHDNNPPFPLFVWGFPHGDPVAQQKVNDYCYGSVHETAVLAKEMIEAYYCQRPAKSYYNGCSTGGRQGLIEAQRYPEDFDGLLIGAPVHYLTLITQRGIWEAQALLGDGDIVPEKLPLLAGAVMKKCDSMDGLVDGLIDDPRNCDFDALTDLPACPDDLEQPDCFTAAQREAIKKIYDGPTGVAATPGEAFGSEAFAPAPPYLGGGFRSGWEGWIIPTPPIGSLGLMLGAGFVQWVGLPPSGGGGHTWDWMTYDFNGPDPQAVIDNMSAKCDAIDPDHRELKKLGGKIIHYDGWADQATGPYQTVDYYESVLDFMGEKKTEDFYRLYMVPGMAHCGGGLGCFDGDALFTALVDWVEEGVEPTSYIGVSFDGRTRPMCPYPEVARYLGEASIDDAENFTCVEIVPAKVLIKPKTLDLGSTGTFKALITFPKGYYYGRGWEMLAVVCEGASAEKVIKFKLKGRTFRKKSKTYIAEFNKEDLVNITAGEDVTFTVTAIFEHKWHKGGRVGFEGSDNVRIIE